MRCFVHVGVQSCSGASCPVPSPTHKRNSVMQVPAACNSNSDRSKRQSRACPDQCYDNKTGWRSCSPVKQRIGRSYRCSLFSAMQAWPLHLISALVFVVDHAQCFCLPQIIRQYSCCCSSTLGFSSKTMKRVVHYVAASLTEHVQDASIALQAQMQMKLQKLLKRTLQRLRRLLTFNLLPQVGFSSILSQPAFIAVSTCSRPASAICFCSPSAF